METFFASMAHAQPLTDINSVASKATNIGNLVVQIAISLAVVWIIVSVVRYLIIGAASDEKRKAARDSIVYGVVGLFIILSVWGLVFILRNSFRTQDRVPVNDINNLNLPRPGTVPN